MRGDVLRRKHTYRICFVWGFLNHHHHRQSWLFHMMDYTYILWSQRKRVRVIFFWSSFACVAFCFHCLRFSVCLGNVGSFYMRSSHSKFVKKWWSIVRSKRNSSVRLRSSRGEMRKRFIFFCNVFSFALCNNRFELIFCAMVCNYVGCELTQPGLCYLSRRVGLE